MKRKIKLHIRRVSPGQTYAVLATFSVVACALYLGFFAATMGYAAEREELKDSIASITTSIGEAELQLLARSQAVDEAMASERGLVAASSKRYVTRTSLTYRAPNETVGR